MELMMELELAVLKVEHSVALMAASTAVKLVALKADNLVERKVPVMVDSTDR